MTRPCKNKKFKLFNIKSGEVLVLNATMEQLNYIMIELLKGKYFVQEKKTDDEFLEECIQKMGLLIKRS
jgi:hypothetical protein